jgi:hypothetical protein
MTMFCIISVMITLSFLNENIPQFSLKNQGTILNCCSWDHEATWRIKRVAFGNIDIHIILNSPPDIGRGTP